MCSCVGAIRAILLVLLQCVYCLINSTYIARAQCVNYQAVCLHWLVLSVLDSSLWFGFFPALVSPHSLMLGHYRVFVCCTVCIAHSHICYNGFHWQTGTNYQGTNTCWHSEASHTAADEHIDPLMAENKLHLITERDDNHNKAGQIDSVGAVCNDKANWMQIELPLLDQRNMWEREA